MWAGANVLSSSFGTQQGDPLGPLLFALALRRATAALRERCPDLDLNAWYLDDGTLVGPRNSLVRALEFLGGPDAQALGLQLNLAKCELWWPSGDQAFPDFPWLSQTFPDFPWTSQLNVG